MAYRLAPFNQMNLLFWQLICRDGMSIKKILVRLIRDQLHTRARGDLCLIRMNSALDSECVIAAMEQHRAALGCDRTLRYPYLAEQTDLSARSFTFCGDDEEKNSPEKMGKN